MFIINKLLILLIFIFSSTLFSSENLTPIHIEEQSSLRLSDLQSTIKKFLENFEFAIEHDQECSITDFLELKILYQEIHSKVICLSKTLNVELLESLQLEYQTLIQETFNQVHQQGLNYIDTLHRDLLEKINTLNSNTDHISIADAIEIKMLTNRYKFIIKLVNTFIDNFNLLLQETLDDSTLPSRLAH